MPRAGRVRKSPYSVEDCAARLNSGRTGPESADAPAPGGCGRAPFGKRPCLSPLFAAGRMAGSSRPLCRRWIPAPRQVAGSYFLLSYPHAQFAQFPAVYGSVPQSKLFVIKNNVFLRFISDIQIKIVFMACQILYFMLLYSCIRNRQGGNTYRRFLWGVRRTYMVTPSMHSPRPPLK